MSELTGTSTRSIVVQISACMKLTLLPSSQFDVHDPSAPGQRLPRHEQSGPTGHDDSGLWRGSAVAISSVATDETGTWT